MAIYQLSQLARASAPATPSFTPSTFSGREGYRQLASDVREYENINNAKAYAEMYGKSKLAEGMEKNKDLQASAATAKDKLEVLSKLMARKEELQKHLATASDPYTVKYINAELAKLPQDLEAQHATAKTAMDDAQSAFKNAMTPYALAATKAQLDPNAVLNVNKEKDVAKMAEKQAEIDNKWNEINNTWLPVLSDPKSSLEQINAAKSNISRLKAEAIESGRQYTLASQGSTYKSPYEDDFYRIANADKNLQETLQSKMTTGKMASDIKKAVTDDAKEAVKEWTNANKEVIKNLNQLSSSVTAFETIANRVAKGGKVSPADFSALVKSVAKMILPGEAVMSDDVKLMAKFGGGESNVASSMAMLGQQLGNAFNSAYSGIKNVSKEVAKGASDVVSDITGKLTGNEKPSTPEQAVKSTAKTANVSMAQIYQDVQAPINTQYLSQVKPIIKLGAEYAQNAKQLINEVQGSIKKVIMNLPDYLSFRNTDALQASTGKSAKEILATQEAQNALDVAITSELDAQFSNIKMGSGGVDVSGLVEEATEPVTEPVAEQNTTPIPQPTTVVEKPAEAAKNAIKQGGKSGAAKSAYQAKQKQKKANPPAPKERPKASATSTSKSKGTREVVKGFE